MIDENLARQELSDAERSRQLCRRKEIYETLHPETRATSAGGAGRAKDTRRQNGDELPDRFTKATAAATGQSERVIQRAVARGKALGDDLDEVRGTSLDRAGELDALTKMPAVAEGGNLRALTGLLRRELIVGPQEVEARRRAHGALRLVVV